MELHQNGTHHVNYREPTLVFCALLVLTAFTVVVSRLGLTPVLSIIAAMGIACSKAALVLIYFMHLKHESRLLWYFLALALVTLTIIFGLTFSDYAFRSGLFT